MNFNNLMIDIETFGTDNDAVVVSIAAIPFTHDKIGEKIYFNVLPISSQLEMGRNIAQETWNWWSERSVNPVSKPTLGNLLLPYMIELSSFILDVMDDNPDFRIWSNPPQFDIAIIEDLYQSVDLKPVWNHNHQCDVRTVKKSLGKERMADIVNEDPHNPVKDCEYQIKLVQRFLKLMNPELTSDPVIDLIDDNQGVVKG